MLSEFRVENFKNFKDELIFRLDQVKNYEFNTDSIMDGIVKTALVYGRNGIGKSNLGLAIFDITLNLTDKEKNLDNYKYFTNLFKNSPVKFYYKFKFDSSYLVYKYEKDNPQNIIKEELYIDGKRLVYYDHKKHEGEVKLAGAETLKNDLKEKNISFVKYLESNSILIENRDNTVFNKFIDFVNNMLFVSSLEKGHHQGFKTRYKLIAKEIIESGKLKDFELFLKSADIGYKLIAKEVDGEKLIFCDFDGHEINLFSIASNGTYSLAALYYWLIDLYKVTLIFIDDFDAFYHNRLARMIVQEVLKGNTQAIITTHNTSIIDNDLLRPDCYFNLVDGKIDSFSGYVQKDLCKAHNLEKMYRTGVFFE
ncbi:MAG: ATP-binding protein [Halanaerobiales bacterium]|nr:ATP-binding protein [Halanaerobiales bacterium]